jgi:signal transduction histidine kinase
MKHRKAHVLLVDDDAKSLLALRAVLEPLGQNLLCARSGEQALRLMLDHDPAVVVLDVRMPGMNGFDTARAIRARKRSGHVPIIFLTGSSGQRDTAFRSYDVGAVDYLVKPVDAPALRAKVAVFVELQRRNAALAAEIAERKAVEKRLRESQAQLRALAARLASAREEERARIAREVHDELGQALTGLKMDVMWLGKHLDKAQGALLEKVATMRHLLDATVQVVRRISTGMRPVILDDNMGLVAAIGWQAKEFQKRMGIRCRVELPAAPVDADGALSTAVFRIFQEVLTNISRHARASSVSVRLEVARSRLTLTVQDDGIGIAARAVRAPASLGLLGMQERAQQFGGELRVRGIRGHGTTVTLRMPLPPART